MNSRIFGATVLALLSLGATARAQPLVTVSQAQMYFTYTAASSTFPVAQTITVSSNAPVAIGTPVITYSGPASNWIAQLGAPGNASPGSPLSMSVFVNTAVLPSLIAGLTYSAQITLPAGTIDPGSVTTVGVFLTVTNAGGGGGGLVSMTATPPVLNINYTPGQAIPITQSVVIDITDRSGVFVTKETVSGGDWLGVSATSFGSTPATLVISINPSALLPGAYGGTVTVTGIQQVVIPVNLTVGTSPFTITPASLTFQAAQNSGLTAPQYLQVTTASPARFSILVSSGSWIQPDFPSATTPSLVPIRINTGGLAQGEYTGTLTLQQGPAYSVDVPITLRIGPPAVLSISPASILANWTIGDSVPLTQTINVRSTSATVQSYTASSAVVTGAGWLSVSPTSGTTPGTVTVNMNPTGLAPGNYLGSVTLTPAAAGSGPTVVSIGLTVNPVPTPVITSVQSAASFASGTVSPGQLVTIIGRGIGPRTLVSFPAGSTSVPTTLGNTTVTFNGVAAPVVYAWATATTVQVPYSVVPGQTVNVRVTYSGAASADFPVATQSIYPGLFTSDGTGRGQLAALNEDFSLNSAANPIRRGGIVVLYGTGHGVTNPPQATGTVTPINGPYPLPLIPPVVYFNGIQGTVLFAAEAPGSIAGLFQINVQVPANIPAGNVSLQVAFGNTATQSGVTIAVQ